VLDTAFARALVLEALRRSVFDEFDDVGQLNPGVFGESSRH